MTPTRRTHLLLWSTAAAGVVGAALAVASVKLWPVAVPPPSAVSASGPREAGSQAATVPALATFEPIFHKDLRRPLVDPPPAAPVAVETAKPAPATVSGVRLVGTVMEANHSYGIFATGLSNIEVRSVGQKLSSGAEVLEIAAKSARLRHTGRTISIPLADPAASPAGRGPLTTADILQRMRERSAAANAQPSPEPPPQRARKQPKKKPADEDPDPLENEEMDEPEIFDPADEPS